MELRGVTKIFGSTVALRGVDVRLPDSGLVVLEGPNGSGKSTLLSVLGALVRPTSGVVDFGRFGRSAQEVRANMGWLSHEVLAYRDLSGRANIELAGRLRGLSGDEAWRQVQQRFDLGGFAARPMRGYSRGQRQRVALARAWVGRPPLLLLDEPTTGLDLAGVELLKGLVEEAVADGALVVIVTHEKGFFSGARRLQLERGRVTCFT